MNIITRYQEPWRHFHTWKHILDIKNCIYNHPYPEIQSVKEALNLAAEYHDAVYKPWGKDNEEESVKLFFKEQSPTTGVGDLVEKIIMATKTHDPTGDFAIDSFLLWDMNVAMGTESEIIQWENQIFKEFQYIPLNKYIPARTKVISIIYDKIQALFDTFVGLPGHNSELVDEKRDFALSYLEQKPYKIGIYPGSFNPFHTGHMSVLTQAEEIFDKVIIAQGINPDKEAPDNPIPNINREVVEYTSLVTELFHYDKNIEYFMVRGLRNEHDMLAEENLRKTIHDINPQIRFTYFCCDPAVEHVSSSMIRGLIKFDENAADRYLITGYNWEPREE